MENKHCGIVAIIGRPNTGKSTLLNRILGEKVAIVSQVPQTTRNIIRGILNEARGQIVFVDTPGLHKPDDQLNKQMNILAEDSASGADVVLHLIDSSKNIGEEEARVVDFLVTSKAPVVLALNKIDLGGKFISEYLALWEKKKGKPVKELADKLIIFPLSALKGTNVDKLLDLLFSLLPQSSPLYPEDALTDFPLRLACADIIRQPLFECMREEIPHSIAVLVDEIAERSEKMAYIKADIFVERPSQKAMVIGKNAQVLKKAGIQARKELEALLEKKVFLDLNVKVKENWRHDTELLKRMGIIL